MLDWVPKLLTFVVAGLVLVVGWNEERVLTGTGISCPDAMIAFLLLLVNTIGREMTLNLPLASSALTNADRPNPVLRKILVPPVTTPLASSVMSVSVRGSIMGTFVF